MSLRSAAATGNGNPLRSVEHVKRAKLLTSAAVTKPISGISFLWKNKDVFDNRLIFFSQRDLEGIPTFP